MEAEQRDKRAQTQERGPLAELDTLLISYQLARWGAYQTFTG